MAQNGGNDSLTALKFSASSPPQISLSSWRAAIAKVLEDPAQPQLKFEPIVDLQRATIAGYEALSRFGGPLQATPDKWFAAADRLGVGVELEARVVRAALTARETLPHGCFLTVNVSPHLLHRPGLVEALTSAGDLTGLVLELTEHIRVEDHDRLVALLTRVRALGATVALDDAGSGYSGLQQMALVRPQLVKIDRSLVDHADRDEVKLALVELLGNYAGRLNASVIAEGVERPEELEAFVRLGVPLAQGWLFGRAGPAWPTLAADQVALMRRLAGSSHQIDQVGSLIERTTAVREDSLSSVSSLFDADEGLQIVAVLDLHDRAVCLLRRASQGPNLTSDPHVLAVSLRVGVNSDITDVATRAMTRREETRFDPIVVGDAYGGFLGIVRIERMMVRLAEFNATGQRANASAGLHYNFPRRNDSEGRGQPK